MGRRGSRGVGDFLLFFLIKSLKATVSGAVKIYVHTFRKLLLVLCSLF